MKIKGILCGLLALGLALGLSSCNKEEASKEVFLKYKNEITKEEFNGFFDKLNSFREAFEVKDSVVSGHTYSYLKLKDEKSTQQLSSEVSFDLSYDKEKKGILYKANKLEKSTSGDEKLNGANVSLATNESFTLFSDAETSYLVNDLRKTYAKRDYNTIYQASNLLYSWALENELYELVMEDENNYYLDNGVYTIVAKTPEEGAEESKLQIAITDTSLKLQMSGIDKDGDPEIMPVDKLNTSFLIEIKLEDIDILPINLVKYKEVA